MKKRILIVAIALLLVAAVVVVALINNNNDSNVKAYDYREGFLITPDSDFDYGMSVNTSFTVKTKDDFTLTMMQEMFFIQDVTSFTVEEVNKNQFKVTLTEDLKYDSVYVLGIKQSDMIMATFVYQTASKFAIAGYLPNTQSTNVPVNTGIEVYFPNADVKNFEQAFSISPDVRGNFEVHDNAYVFVPSDNLEYKTVYTVTLAGGIIENSDGQLISDQTVFSFETMAKEEEVSAYKYRGYVNFNKLMYEYPGNGMVSIPYYMNMPEESQTVSMMTDVYKFDSGNQMVSYIKEVLAKPYWSMYNADEAKLDTSGLTSVQSFNNQVSYTNNNYQFVLDIPEKLEKGTYLVKMTWEHGETFVFIQVTDLSAYIFDDDENTYVWVHHLLTKESTDASVNGINTSNEGLAVVPNKSLEDNVIVISDDDNETYIFKNPYYYGTYNNFWNVLTTDRSLYKPDDTVNFFGFISPREGNLSESKVTVEINRGYFYYYFDNTRNSSRFIPPFPMQEVPLVSLEVPLVNGFYEGDVTLPSLSEGYYTITVKYDGKQISNQYFNVEEYVKPSMTISITPDKKAVFANEQVTFNVNTSFFEGTPVSGLDVTYYINYNNEYIESDAKSDLNGNVSFRYTPKYQDKAQGTRYIYVGVRAQLPEQGELNTTTAVAVYMNDIDYTYETDIKDKMILLNGNVFNFVPDYKTGGVINSGGYSFEDISMNLYKNTLVKKESGTYYDYINKKTVKQYTYETEKTLIQSKTLKTDADGNFKTEFPYTEADRTWYTIEMSVKDKNNREVDKTAYISARYNYEAYSYMGYQTELDKETYSINDTVKARFVYGDEDVQANQYLFIIAQNGIRKTIITDKNIAEFSFLEDYIPDVLIQTVAFDGSSYVSSYQEQVRFTKEDRKLNVQITTDKKDYKPGEQAVVSVKVTDINNNPVSAKILISAVDEALLSLSDINIDFLEELYSYVDSGIRNTYGTHKDGMNIFYDNNYRGGMGYDLEQSFSDSMISSEAPIPSPTLNGNKSSDAVIRSEFKDTAAFLTIQTGNDGLGVAPLNLPDNITSWRLFGNAMSNDYFAGGGYININTTLPFFINVVTSDMFLINDHAYVGVTGYGDKLSINDMIDYKVYLKSNPDDFSTVTARAFERVNLPLPSFKEGNDSIIVEAYTDGYSDGLETKIKVKESYNRVQVTDSYQVSNQMILKSGSYGNTTLVFTDLEYMDYVTKAFGIAYYSSERLELLLARDKAVSILDSYLTDENWIKQENTVDYKKYQQSDGGLSILPYAQSDLKVTVDNFSYVRDSIDENLLLGYLYQQLNDNGSDAYVLYGLSQFNQPILLELDRTSKILNLTTEQLTYLALAYYNIGDTYQANEIFETRIKPQIVSVDPYEFINEKNEDYSIYVTSKVAYLAKLLNRDEAAGLFKYSVNHYSKEYVINNFTALYLDLQLKDKKESSSSFTYSYMGYTKEINFKDGKWFSYEIPSINLDQFKISDVNGDIGLLMTYEKDADITKINDSDVIKVTRKYYDGTTNQEKRVFSIGDIVKVEIKVEKGKNFIDTIYEVTDILPSGLKAIEKPYQYLGSNYEYTYMRANQQTAKATVGKYFIENEGTIVYYARVTNMGDYGVMGTYVKLLQSNEVVYQDNDSTITIGE
ncbi:MAG: Ig-like domain-containing protein [Clostridia bacterium]|nr:Ig-like domain-containing protein [Clostridia bacterium]